MLTLLIALGALLIAVVGCALLSPGERRDQLMEDIAQSFF